MNTKVKSLRLSEELDQAINYVSEREKIEASHSLRKLAHMGFESYVAKQYQTGEITLRQASELLGINLSEALDVFYRLGVKGNTGSTEVWESIAALDDRRSKKS